jgi:hypothetical protein
VVQTVVLDELLYKSGKHMLIAGVKQLGIGEIPCVEVLQINRYDFARRAIDGDGRWLRVARWQKDVLASDFQVSRRGHDRKICAVHVRVHG